jgi:hypothetical protein
MRRTSAILVAALTLPSLSRAAAGKKVRLAQLGEVLCRDTIGKISRLR